jgi:hypothetical protein
MAAQVAAGSYLARGAAAASRLVAEGAADAEFLEARTVIARFYMTQLLPVVHGLLPAVTAGSDDLFALSPTQLAG